MADLGMAEGFDIGLEMSGAEAAFNQMLDSMNHGGRVAVLGIPSAAITLDVAELIFKGIEIQGIYGRRIFETWYKMAAMLQSGLDVSGIVTHRLPAERYEEAFDIVGRGECGKLVLDWT
jgi:threonine 3-dehydrogenase